MRELRSIGCSPSVSVCFYFCCAKYHGTAGNPVVRTLPLTLDFNPTLRCAMAKAWVVSRQRAATIFAKDYEPDGRLLVSGCVRHFISKSAGDASLRSLRGGHAHVEFLAFDPIFHQ